MKNTYTTKREIDRSEFNSLNKMKSHSSSKPKLDGNPYSQRTHEKNNNKLFKFQNMSKLIVSQIDEILKDQPPNSGSISGLSNIEYNSAKPYQIYGKEDLGLYSNLKEDLYPKIKIENSIRETKQNFSENFENKLQIKRKIIKEESKINPEVINKPNKSKLKKNPKKKKEVFMTDVGIEGNQTQLETKIKSKYMEEQDKQIREMLDNIDDTDGILDEKEEREYLRRNPEKKDEVIEIKNLIAQVDNYKKSLTDEFDELQFLIKFVDDTADRITRHKQGVSKIFKKAGLKPKTDYDIPEEQEIKEEKTFYAQDGSYDTTKNLSVVKTNLNKIYDSMLGFYSKFNSNIMENNESEPTADLAKYKRRSLKK